MMQKADIPNLNPAQLQMCDAIERQFPEMSRNQCARIVATFFECMNAQMKETIVRGGGGIAREIPSAPRELARAANVAAAPSQPPRTRKRAASPPTGVGLGMKAEADRDAVATGQSPDVAGQ
jgi:hypothetical protein